MVPTQTAADNALDVKDLADASHTVDGVGLFVLARAVLVAVGDVAGIAARSLKGTRDP